MIRLLSLVTFLTVVTIGTSQELFCSSLSEFFIPDIKANWYGAVEYCQRIGMRLVVVDSEAKHTEIVRLGIDTGTIGDSLWIGANDLALEGRVIWHATGRWVTFSKWKAGEPNNLREREHCVHMWYDPSRKILGEWNDALCTNSYYFVCENVPI
ncbi:hepatic lectin-like [Ochlerotatus camptorhynchus]|uniref:hepatic lectin-like n=1 Tax=Ochlerotatus camptorhynchus TaxID=644619 RepID=UPI0031D8B3D2